MQASWTAVVTRQLLALPSYFPYYLSCASSSNAVVAALGGDMQTPVSCVWGICCCILLLTLSEPAGDNPKGQPSNAESEDALLQQLQDGEDGKDKALGAIEAHGVSFSATNLL